MSENTSSNKQNQIRNAVEITLRLALLFLLLYWCYGVVKPFADFFIWSVIFAVALYPPYKWLFLKLGGKKALSSVLIVCTMLAILLMPVALFAKSMYEGIIYMKAQYESNGSLLPVATEKIATLPVIGPVIYEKWNALSSNIGSTIQEYAPQLKDASLAVISSIASAGIGFIKLFVSVIIAGFLLVNSEASANLTKGFFNKIFGKNGDEYASMAENTIRVVVKGSLGVAFIQSFCFGVGLVLVGVPAAGLLFMLSLIFGIIQVGIFPVAIPVIIYVFASYSTTTAVIFLIWGVIISLLDNVLRPYLLGKGSDVPMIVLFIGSMGGFIHSGIVGLFTGAIIFAVTYKLFLYWLDQSEPGEIKNPAKKLKSV